MLLVVVLFGYFPWVSFGLNAFDTQPWFVLFGMMWLLFFRIKIKRDYLKIFICIFYQ